MKTIFKIEITIQASKRNNFSRVSIFVKKLLTPSIFGHRKATVVKKIQYSEYNLNESIGISLLSSDGCRDKNDKSHSKELKNEKKLEKFVKNEQIHNGTNFGKKDTVTFSFKKKYT